MGGAGEIENPKENGQVGEVAKGAGQHDDPFVHSILALPADPFQADKGPKRSGKKAARIVSWEVGHAEERRVKHASQIAEGMPEVLAPEKHPRDQAKCKG